jgi:serine/threonine protein kinase
MAKELLPGNVLQNGKYKIVKVLGISSFGITYKALTSVQDSGIPNNTQVAVKEFFMHDFSSRAEDGSIIINSESSIIRNYMHKFKQQADRLKSLNHDNINKVLDVFYENNTYYVVFEFIDGVTMDYYVKSNGRLSETESLLVTKEIGLALRYIHNKNIVHLDIKPGNMMISKDHHVYLIDFGLAKQYNKDGEAETSTSWGIGTPIYSPMDRQSSRGGKIPLTFDIYGLAASLYYMLTGQLPPEAEDVLNDGFPSDSLHKYDISSNTIACIEKAMSPMRNVRYQSIDDFLKALSIPIGNNIQEDTEYFEYDDGIIVEKVDKAQALPIGTKLHGKSYDYEIKNVLGQGTFGITYLADLIVKGALGSLGSSIHVAIKEFFMRDVNGRQNTSVTAGSKGGIYDKYKEKFISESLRLSELKHNNIVKVLEAFEDNNTYYYAMEYIEGMSLDDYIKESDGIGVREAISITNEIGEALSYMHSHKMLHLDLKPQNVMRRSDGHVVLIDFGLAKQYDENGKPETSTSVGAGTRGYAPIEQANYHDGKDFPVTMDVYALAASLYKMLTCLSPQDASDVLNDGLDVSPLTKRMVGESIINVIEMGMSPMKKNRPQTVSDFLELLNHTLY